MSYSLADVLNALAAQEEPVYYSRFPRRGQQSASQQQRLQQQLLQQQLQQQMLQQQQQQQYAYDDDDDESDDFYAARYPDYYSSGFPFAAPFYPSRRAVRPQQAAAPPQQPPQQQSLDLADILNLLTGGPAASLDADGDTDVESKPQETQRASGSSTPATPATEKKPQEKEQQQQQQQQPSTLPAKPNDQEHPKSKPDAQQVINPLLKRHSTASFKDPKPKVEISSRNLRNSSLPFSPQANVYEDDKEYTVILAISGASLKDLDIDFHPSTNEIVVKGNIPDPSSIVNKEDQTKNVKISEIRTGSVERRIKFPALPKILDEQIKAKYVNGLLTIRIPKNNEKETKPKRKVTIEDVPDEELVYEETGGLIQ